MSEDTGQPMELVIRRTRAHPAVVIPHLTRWETTEFKTRGSNKHKSGTTVTVTITDEGLMQLRSVLNHMHLPDTTG